MDHWMARAAPAIGASRLLDVRLPGTHNSFSRNCGRLGVIANIAKNQTTSVDEQLSMGVRFFDCRLRYTNNGRDCEEPSVWTFHGDEKIGGNSDEFFPILDGMGAFLAQPEHSREVLVLALSHLDGFPAFAANPGPIMNVWGALQRAFGGKIANRATVSIATVTMADLWQQGAQVVVFLDDGVPDDVVSEQGLPFWHGRHFDGGLQSRWPDKESVAELMLRNDDILHGDIRRDHHRLNVMQTNVTPAGSLKIVDVAVNGLEETRSRLTNETYQRLFRLRAGRAVWFGEVSESALPDSGCHTVSVVERCASGDTNPVVLCTCKADGRRPFFFVSLRATHEDSAGGHHTKIRPRHVGRGEFPDDYTSQAVITVGDVSYVYMHSASSQSRIRDEYPWRLQRVDKSSEGAYALYEHPPCHGLWGRYWRIAVGIPADSTSACPTTGGLFIYDPKTGEFQIRAVSAEGKVNNDPCCAAYLLPGFQAFCLVRLPESSTVTSSSRLLLFAYGPDVNGFGRRWELIPVAFAENGPELFPKASTSGALDGIHDPDVDQVSCAHLPVHNPPGATRPYLLLSNSGSEQRAIIPVDNSDDPALSEPRPALALEEATCSLWDVIGPACALELPAPEGGGETDHAIVGMRPNGTLMTQGIERRQPRINAVIGDFVTQEWCEALTSIYVPAV